MVEEAVVEVAVVVVVEDEISLDLWYHVLELMILI